MKPAKTFALEVKGVQGIISNSSRLATIVDIKLE
jgi:hypothetical protein